MYILKLIAYVLVLIGALNWGLVGAFNLNLVSLLFGDMTLIARIIYILIGVSAIIYLFGSYQYFDRNKY